MIKEIYPVTLSLAGICQSVYLVQELSRLGKCDDYAFEICLRSILEINPTSIINVYGNNEKNLNIGLKKLISIFSFSNFTYSNIVLIKYIFNMIILEKKLKKNYMMINTLKKKYH